MYRRIKKFRRKAYPYMRTAGKALSIGISAARVAAQVASLINAEWKYYDRSDVDTNVTSAGAILYLSNMAQGDTEITRNGVSILPKGISVRMKMTINGSATNSLCRAMIVVDRECDGAEPSISEVLDSVDVMSFRNRDNKGRFAMLYDKTFTLRALDKQEINIKFNKKFNSPSKRPNPKRKWYHIQYGGSSAAITDLRKGNIFLFFISDEATYSPTVKTFSRLTYVDN